MLTITGFLELAIPLTNSGEDNLEEIEEDIQKALEVRSLGEVSGAGTGLGFRILDVDIHDHKHIGDVVQLLKKILLEYQLPKGVFVQIQQPYKKREQIS